MAKFTTETYILKRDILTFVRKITHTLRLPERKFITDMIYGLLAAESCKLSDISDALHEKIKKKNTIERLSKNLAKGVPMEAWKFYLHMIKKWEDNPVIHIDDTDVSKEYGKKFEAIGRVRDGSASGNKNIYKNGYYITEGTVLTKSFHPISFFSKVHSSHEKDYISANAITFAAIERGAKLFKKAMFVMDRGYDDNKMFLMLDKLGQHYIIRLTRNRKLLLGNGKWAKASEMCARRKGKIKMELHYKGKEHVAYLSHVKTRITASRKDINLVLIYDITEHPMMLATNKEIKSKEDVIEIARTYFSRWKVEEYFRAKKQIFEFEDFRVRNLAAINYLNFLVTVAMAYLNHVSMLGDTNKMKVSIIKKADPLKAKVAFVYYRVAKGICAILVYARAGVRHWFKTKRPKYRQLRFKLII